MSWEWDDDARGIGRGIGRGIWTWIFCYKLRGPSPHIAGYVCSHSNHVLFAKVAWGFCVCSVVVPSGISALNSTGVRHDHGRQRSETCSLKSPKQRLWSGLKLTQARWATLRPRLPLSNTSVAERPRKRLWHTTYLMLQHAKLSSLLESTTKDNG